MGRVGGSWGEWETVILFTLPTRRGRGGWINVVFNGWRGHTHSKPWNCSHFMLYWMAIAMFSLRSTSSRPICSLAFIAELNCHFRTSWMQATTLLLLITIMESSRFEAYNIKPQLVNAATHARWFLLFFENFTPNACGQHHLLFIGITSIAELISKKFSISLSQRLR